MRRAFPEKWRRDRSPRAGSFALADRKRPGPDGGSHLVEGTGAPPGNSRRNGRWHLWPHGDPWAGTGPTTRCRAEHDDEHRTEKKVVSGRRGMVYGNRQEIKGNTRTREDRVRALCTVVGPGAAIDGLGVPLRSGAPLRTPGPRPGRNAQRPGQNPPVPYSRWPGCCGPRQTQAPAPRP